MTRLSDMPNIGLIVEQKLIAAGIETPEMLISMGSRSAFLRLRSMDPTACLSMLNGLEGAVQGIRWHHLPDRDRQELKRFFQALR